MLILHLRSHEYLTINDNITIQVDRTGPEQTTLAIDAPREIPVVRGTLLERAGKAPPACLERGKKPRVKISS